MQFNILKTVERPFTASIQKKSTILHLRWTEHLKTEILMQINQVTVLPRKAKDLSLYGIVNELIHEAAPLAVHNRNFVINNIPADLRLETSGSIISSVLSKLFSTVFRHTQNSGIMISAKVYGLVVLVQVKSNGNISPALPEDIGNACLKAQTTGGVVEMISYENKEACVAYCFLNVAGAA